VKPACDPEMDYKALVQQGYDTCAASYAKARSSCPPTELGSLTSRLCAGATVLDIGCGTGVPIAQELARKYRVTGVDISGEQIRRARLNVPEAAFVQSEIMTLELADSRFDAAVVFYTVFHLPREEHAGLFQRIHGWLNPGGYLLATLSQLDQAAYTEDDFFGVTMYWSNFGLDDYKRILTSLGFRVLETTIIGHGYGPGASNERHPLVLAQREQ